MRRAAGSIAARGARAASTASTTSTSSIFRDSAANKTGLAYALDGTMRSGAHDMIVFGAGALAALASRRNALAFFQGHRHVYSTMEGHLDAAAQSHNDPTGALWRRVRSLRRGEALERDVAELGGSLAEAPSPATQRYVDQLDAAAASPLPLLISHFYVRYFADLFGGSMLGKPTRAALNTCSGVQFSGTPAFYVHDAAVTTDRRAYIEDLYRSVNAAGEAAHLDAAGTKALVTEAEVAFALNAELYREAAPAGTGLAGLFGLAIVGGARVAGGLAMQSISRAPV